MGILRANLFLCLGIFTALEARGPEPGRPIPSFSLSDQSGAVRTFNNLKGPNGLMLVFYRSADW